MYPKSFQRLIQAFKKLPQVGNKAAERYAYAVFQMKSTEVNELLTSISEVKEKVVQCQQCFHLAEDALCEICQDPSRDHSIICVVNSSKDVLAMEKTGFYRGLYHVLLGEIAPTKGVMPQDLTIDELLGRLDANVKELILATNTTVEGETTAMYLKKILNNNEIKVTRLAHGIPMGGQLDYADELTLSKAITGRTKY